MYVCQGLMLKTVYIKASKKGYLTVPLEFDATAS